MSASSPGKARVYFGPSGWSYPDWEGIVYPKSRGGRFDALRYISRFFSAVEVNTSFYRIPDVSMTSPWPGRVEQSERFRFVFKLTQTFTHEHEDYPAKDVTSFAASIEPIADAGMFGGILMQFPWSFKCQPSAWHRLGRLVEDFGQYPLVVELRHGSWDADDVRDRLSELHVNYCNIDQPQLSDCMPPSAHATGPVGYVRLHGRRGDTWFADGVEVTERYNYLYEESELEEWMTRVRHLADKTASLFVFANNHYQGKAAANALQLRAMWENDRIDVPPEILPHFPALQSIARRHEPEDGEQMSLFG